MLISKSWNMTSLVHHLEVVLTTENIKNSIHQQSKINHNNAQTLDSTYLKSGRRSKYIIPPNCTSSRHTFTPKPPSRCFLLPRPLPSSPRLHFVHGLSFSLGERGSSLLAGEEERSWAHNWRSLVGELEGGGLFKHSRVNHFCLVCCVFPVHSP